MTAVEARLARLEQAVQRLSGQVGGGEQLSPNYLTVTPSGQVGANFTGLVNAQGLIMPASTSFPPGLVNRIEWDRADNGTMVARVYGQINHLAVDQSVASLEAIASAGATNGSIAQIQAVDDLGSANAGVLAEQASRGGSGTFVQVFAGTKSLFLLDPSGDSSFLQLTSPAQLFIDGPHALAVPAMAAGSQVGVNFNTTRAAWTTAQVIAGVAYPGAGGVVICGGGLYIGGNLWQAVFSNPLAAQAATTAIAFVVGF